jgi:hypothetical protein
MKYQSRPLSEMVSGRLFLFARIYSRGLVLDSSTYYGLRTAATMPSVLIAFESAVRTLAFLYAYPAICAWE